MNSLLHELHLVQYDSMIETIDFLLQKMTFTVEEQILLLKFKGELSKAIGQECELSLSDETYDALIGCFQSYTEQVSPILKEKCMYLSFVMSKFE